jgi:hypothetical protein
MKHVAQLWADRLREELPPEIEISVNARGIVSTRGRGALRGSSSFGWLPVFLRLPLPRRVLLQMFFENALDDLKSRMTTYTGTLARAISDSACFSGPPRGLARVRRLGGSCCA